MSPPEAPAAGPPDPLEEPLTKGPLRGATATALEALGIRTVGELLRHYPRRYLRWGELTPLSQLRTGEEVTVLAQVVSATERPMRQRRGSLLTVVVTDGTERLDLTFFQARKLAHLLQPGRQALFSGTVGEYRGRRQLTHPQLEPVEEGMDGTEQAGRPMPVYPATQKTTSLTIRKAVRVVLDVLPPLQDPVPAPIRARLGMLGLREALEQVHRPDDDASWRAGQRRLRFEEALVLQVALARRRADESRRPATPRRPVAGGLLSAFDERLPFTLTAGQRAVADQLAADIAEDHPMHRLLQGEVGSGKTVVALRAMLAVVDGGGQAALLAPTEVLAAQHHRSITALLGDLAAGGMLGGDDRGTRVELLTGSQPTAARRRALLAAVSGEAGIVVGTHALLQDRVEFADLGLVVVDEQHRFGVEQRDTLRAKGTTGVPHLLVMTATPIPRTVAMTVFGDLETSTLREEVDAGHQGYVVCPRIGEPGEADELPPTPDGEPDPQRPPRAVLEVLAELRGHPALAGLRVEALHGRLPAEERDAVMAAFQAGQVHVLVATTVIEVGVDVPNATAMVVLDAERFGVSQLHQLRGRVGRGSAPGVCLLVSESEAGTPARERLDAVAATLDGFELARVDLEQRREGDVLGANQSGGRSSLRLLSVLRDEKVIEQARHEATALVAEDPDLDGAPALRRAMQDLLDPEREAYLDKG